MINFRNKDEAGPSALIVLALLILLGGLGWMLFVPAPTVANIATKNSAAKQQIVTDIALAKQQSEDEREAIEPLVWTGDEDSVSANMLAEVSVLARKDGLTISAFRPQREQDLSGITELPYTVEAAGSYQGIHALMTSLDSQHSRIVLQQAQITASAVNQGAATSAASLNNVTATLGLSAYLATDPNLAPASTAPAAQKTTVRRVNG